MCHIFVGINQNKDCNTPSKFCCKQDHYQQGETREWRKLHTEELTDLYSATNIIRVIKSRRMRWAVHVVHMGENRDLYIFLVGKPEGKRPLGRPRHRWDDNIKVDLQEVGSGGMDGI